MIKQQLYVIALATGLVLSALAVGSNAHAQDSSDEMENLFSKEEEQQAPAPAPVEKAEPKQEAKQPEPKEVTALDQLEQFDDIAVIQKRYLPKTKRFEFYIAPTLILNDAFFLNMGINGRLGYYFQERCGIEFQGSFLTVSERQVTTDLNEKRGVRTSSFVTPKNCYGVDFKWSPIYGKTSWRNRRITPFDMYFSGGLGLTGTNQGQSETTLHLGAGQIFALSKGRAVRWDFSWNMFQAKSSLDTSGQASLYHNLFLSLGMSFFFPEATYR